MGGCSDTRLFCSGRQRDVFDVMCLTRCVCSLNVIKTVFLPAAVETYALKWYTYNR